MKQISCIVYVHDIGHCSSTKNFLLQNFWNRARKEESERERWESSIQDLCVCERENVLLRQNFDCNLQQTSRWMHFEAKVLGSDSLSHSNTHKPWIVQKQFKLAANS